MQTSATIFRTNMGRRHWTCR